LREVVRSSGVGVVEADSLRFRDWLELSGRWGHDSMCAPFLDLAKVGANNSKNRMPGLGYCKDKARDARIQRHRI
jgi:hypothetical protein